LLQDKGSNSRKEVKKDAAKAAAKERDIGAALPQSPFRRGTTFNQQIEIAKYRQFELLKRDEVLTMNIPMHYSTYDNKMELAKLWDVKKRDDPIFLEIQQLMCQKHEVTEKFMSSKASLNVKQRSTDDMINGVLVVPSNNKRNKSCQSSICTTEGYVTPLNHQIPPTSSISFNSETEADNEVEIWEPPLPIGFLPLDIYAKDDKGNNDKSNK
jgi:hypothetical protein